MDVPALVAAAINAWLLGVASALLGPALQAAGTLVLLTPQLDGVPAVAAGWHLVQGIANALFILAWLACGVLVMSGPGDRRYAAKLLVPRVGLAALLANTSLALCGALIALNNALVAAIVGPSPADRSAALFALVALPGSSGDVLGLIVAIATAVLAILLVAVAVLRDLVLVVATAVAPLALATYALPQCEAVARIWGRVYGAVLFVQVIQVVAVVLGGALLRGSGAGLWPASPLVPGVLAVALVYLLARLPLAAFDIAVRMSVVTVPSLHLALRGLRP